MSWTERGGPAQGWTFLTNHARALACVAREPDVRIRTVAQCAGITERAAQKIISELVEAGYLTRHRLGRRNSYEVHPDRPLRHPLERHHTVGELLRVLLDRPACEPSAEEPSGRPPAPSAWTGARRADEGAGARPQPEAPSPAEEGSPASAAGTAGSSSRSAAARRARSPRRS